MSNAVSSLERALPLIHPTAKGIPSWMHSFDRLMQHIDEGLLKVRAPNGMEYCYGRQGSASRATILVHTPRFFNRVMHGGSLALGESYMDRDWDVEGDHLCDFLGILLRNRLDQRVHVSLRMALGAAWDRLRSLPISPARAARDIRHHYDLSNEFYALMLDRSMAYSCGYEAAEGDSLERMQEQKYRLISQKLGLEQGGTLLDIGCGWGGLLIDSAMHSPRLHARGITLSPAQHRWACERILEHRLEHRIRVDIEDYREAGGRYDYVCSVGMFEHVGRGQAPEFMRRLGSLLAPRGRGLLHTIALTDRPAVPPDPWTQRYIFPGSRLPRLEEMVVAHVENLKPHYATTLRHWKHNVDRNRERIHRLSPRFDDRFFRMWNYYLQSCEAGFRHSSMELYQVLFCKEGAWPLPAQLGTW